MFKLKIVNPEKKIFSDNISMLVVKNKLGEMGIIKGHSPLITEIIPSRIRIIINNNNIIFYISGGILEIKRDKVIILADTVLRNKYLDNKEIKKTLFKNVKRNFNYSKASIELAYSIAKIKIFRKLKK